MKDIDMGHKWGSPKRHSQSQNNDYSSLNDEDLKKMEKIFKQMDAKTLNEFASKKAEELVQGKREERLTTSQIRNVLDEIQKMREYDETRLQLIRPKLAYTAGKHGGRVRDFQVIMEEAIRLANRDNFEFFKAFVEAIVAYHRYHGGKE